MSHAETCCARQTDFLKTQELTNVASPTFCPVLNDIVLPKTTTPGTLYGGSIAISFDSSTLIVGAREYVIPNSKTPVGAVFVYRKEKTGFAPYVLQQVMLPESVQEFSDFGQKVALSANGRRLLVSAIGQNASNDITRSGAVYVYDLVGCSFCFRQTQKLIAQKRLKDGTLVSESVIDGNFGSSLSLSADGTVAMVSSNPQKQPGVFLYCVNSNDPVCNKFDKFLSFAAFLLPSDAEVSALAGKAIALKEFGYSLTLSRDGKRAVVGDPTASTQSIETGAALLFERQKCSKNWSLVQVFDDQPVGTQESEIGADVRITPDGEHLFVFSSFTDASLPSAPFTAVYSIENRERRFSLSQIIESLITQVPFTLSPFRVNYLGLADSSCLLTIGFSDSDDRQGEVVVYKRCSKKTGFSISPSQTITDPRGLDGFSSAISGNGTTLAFSTFEEDLSEFVSTYVSKKYLCE